LTTESSFDVTYFTNGSDNEPRILSEEGESEFYAFGNSVYDSPFCKVQNACREFEDILNSCDSKSTTLLNQKETLKGKLLNLLKSSTRLKLNLDRRNMHYIIYIDFCFYKKTGIFLIHRLKNKPIMPVDEFLFLS
jgi:hypothetical protein